MSRWKFHDPIKIGRRGVEFYTKSIEDYFYVHFTETSGNKYDWITNFTFLLCAIFEGNKKLKCHKGFLTLAYIAIDKLKPIIEKQKISTFLISGVSQGGAVAVITALLLQKQYPDCQFFVKGFGSPACVNLKLKKYIKHLKKSNIMYVEKDYYKLDIIVNLIPYWLFGLFHETKPYAVKKLITKWYQVFQFIKNHRDIVRWGYSVKGIKQKK